MVDDLLFSRDPKEDDTIVAMLASALRRDISFGALLPDQKLKIADLRMRYGGSNHSMRETLRLLSAEGLVEATAQRGFRVTSATAQDMDDIAMLRGEIERLGLTLALRHSSIEWEGEVIAAHHALRKTEDAVAQVPADTEALEWDEACRVFSATLISACGSPRLIDLHAKFFNQSRRFRLALLREGLLDFTARRTRQDGLLRAVLTKDAETAHRLHQVDIQADFKPEPPPGASQTILGRTS